MPASSVLSLRILLGESGFITHPLTPDAPLNLPAFFAGDVVPVRLLAYQRASGDQSQINAVDVSGMSPLLSLGEPGTRPEVGFWNLTFDGITSRPIPANCMASDVEKILNVSTPIGCYVTGSPIDFVLSRTGNGAKDAPTVSYDGEVNTVVRVDTINEGDANTPAQWRVVILSEMLAFCQNWKAGSITPASSIESKGGGVFVLTLDPAVESGFFILVVNGAPTQLISFSASMAEIQNAIASTGSAGVGAIAIANQQGGIVIALKLGNPATLTINDALLQIPASLLGSLDLTGNAVKELLEAVQFESVQLAVRLSGMWTCASTQAILKKPNTMQSTSTQFNPPLGTPTANIPLLTAVTGLTGGGASNLDGVHTTQLARGAMVQLVLPGPPPLVEQWEFIADPDPGVTVSNPANGVIVPLDYNINTNANIWAQRL